MTLTHAQRRTLTDIRRTLASVQVEIKWLRFVLVFRAYNPDEPRVPAGNPQGGQWTRGGSGRTRVAQLIVRRTGPMRMIGRTMSDVSSGEAVRVDTSDIRVQQALQRIRTIDPDWRPTPGLSEGIEGHIRTNEQIIREAEARWRALGGVSPKADPIVDIYRPGGRLLGRPGVNESIRIVSPQQM